MKTTGINDRDKPYPAANDTERDKPFRGYPTRVVRLDPIPLEIHRDFIPVDGNSIKGDTLPAPPGRGTP